MRKVRVGVDVDGVLADFQPHMISHINLLHGTEYTVDHMVQFEITNLIPQEKIHFFWKSFGENVRVHRNLEPLPGAADGYHRLCEVADVYIVTSHLHSAETWCFDRDLWLEKHFGVHHKKIIHTAAKHMFSGKVLVDDREANIESFKEEDPSRFGVLWAQRYNENSTTGDLRTDSWDVLIDAVKRLT